MSKLDITRIKFNGKLEILADSIDSGKQLDKLEFTRALDILVSGFGLEPFFHSPLNGSMKCRIQDSHHFTVESVLQEHKEYMLDTGAFKEYDDYEHYDIYLSRLAVELPVSSGLEHKVQI